MCYGCWEKAGSPKIVNEKTLAAQPLISAVYEASCVGGNLHIVLDDFNIDDEDVEACVKFIDEWDRDHPEGFDAKLSIYRDTAAERECIAAFRAMTVDERASALAIHDGYVVFSAAPKEPT